MPATEEAPGAPQPLGGVRVFACVTPIPSPAVCSSQVSLRFAAGGGGEAVSPLLGSAVASVHLLGSQCACDRGNLCEHGFL